MTIFRPSSGETGTLVISPYPTMGHDANTGPRYQREADLTGFDIMGITRPGTRTLRFSPRLQQRLSSPEKLDALCAEEAETIAPSTQNYDRVIVRAQSAGTFLALGITWSGLIRATHFLSEGGIFMLTKPDGDLPNPLVERYKWICYKLTANQYAAPPHPDWKKPPSQKLSWRQKRAEAGMFMVETSHYSIIWRSTYSAQRTLTLAEQRPELPILCKLPEHSPATTLERAISFQRQLREVDERRISLARPVARAAAIIDYGGWHEDIEYPDYGARSLLQVAAMQSFVI